MTPPVPTRGTPAGRVYNDLRNLARSHKRDPAEYITLYTLEGFLSRLAASEFASDFVLKGHLSVRRIRKPLAESVLETIDHASKLMHD